MSKVSIIIPVFNQVALTRQCLQSVSETCPSTGVQIIVIDNGSTDQTADLLKPRQSSTFQFVQNDHNRGFGYACNQGAALARGDFLLFLNNDTEVDPDFLTAAVARADPARPASSVPAHFARSV
jgi:GT2 family glycosyltransferase